MTTYNFLINSLVREGIVHDFQRHLMHNFIYYLLTVTSIMNINCPATCQQLLLSVLFWQVWVMFDTNDLWYYHTSPPWKKGKKCNLVMGISYKKLWWTNYWFVFNVTWILINLPHSFRQILEIKCWWKTT